jgi:uncharacterized protein YecE (DUF72 family)
MAGRFYAGTSGFSFPEWRGSLYPAGLPAGEMLRHYSRALRSVEINATFYRFPAPTQVAQWRAATPRGFRFGLKAHRVITHHRRLRDVGDAVRTFADRIAGLKDRRGPILFQLPPTLRCDIALLGDFLAALPLRDCAVEFRHASWHDDRVYALLAKHGTALAIMESDDDEPVMEFVGPLVYLRLHRSVYPSAALTRWARRIREQIARGKDVYAYFTHEEGAPAPTYARRLQAMVDDARTTP